MPYNNIRENNIFKPELLELHKYLYANLLKDTITWAGGRKIGNKNTGARPQIASMLIKKMLWKDGSINHYGSDLVTDFICSKLPGCLEKKPDIIKAWKKESYESYLPEYSSERMYVYRAFINLFLNNNKLNKEDKTEFINYTELENVLRTEEETKMKIEKENKLKIEAIQEYQSMLTKEADKIITGTLVDIDYNWKEASKKVDMSRDTFFRHRNRHKLAVLKIYKIKAASSE